MCQSRHGARFRIAAVTIGLALFAALWPAGDADAHSGSATFETLEARAGSDLVIHLRIAVRYSNDHEPAERAFLSAEATSPDGRKVAAVQLTRGDGGVYAGALHVDEPGEWTVEITSSFPPGRTSLTVDVGDDEDDRSPLVIVGLVAACLALIVVALVLIRRRR